MRVQDVMDPKYPCLYTDELATKARAVLRNRGLRILPVVDKGKRLAGLLSRQDVMTITSSISPIRVKGIMSTPKFVATSGMDAISVVREMVRLDEWYAPVVRSSQDHTYIGVLGLEHIIDALLKSKAARLSIPLSEIMSTQLFACSPDDEVDDVWRLMQERSFSGCPVVVKGRPVGMLTQQNLLESGGILPGFEAKKGRFKAPSKISSVMKTPAVSLKSKDTVKDAAELMLKRNIGRVPIVDEKGKLVGIVDREDVVKALIR